VPDISKLSVVLDDPEIRLLIFALSHTRLTHPAAEPGAARLRAIVLQLADTTDPQQYRSWLSDDAPNMRMTVDQVRMTVGERAIDDLSSFVGGSPSAIAWQLAAVLPDLVDAVSPDGEVVDVDQLSRELEDASAYDDSSAGAFGSHLY